MLVRHYWAIEECKESIPCMSLPKTGKPRILAQKRINKALESAQDRIER